MTRNQGQITHQRKNSSTRPIEILLVSGYSPKISSGLHALAERWRVPGVNLSVEAPTPVADLPGRLRQDVDVLILDGHGYDEDLPRVGRLRLTPEVLRDETGSGISASVFVLGACFGASPHFLQSLEKCVDGPTVFLGCTGIARYEDVHLFDGVIDLATRLGPNPVTSALYAGMAEMFPQQGASGWRPKLLL